MHVQRFPPPSVYGRLRVERSDLAPARWLEQRPPGNDGFGTVAGVCAPGFEAYARILHPARLGADPVRWDRVAALYGHSVSAVTRWPDLIGAQDPFLYRNDDTPAVPDVWDEHPHEGPTPADVARTLISVLSRHTRTPEQCWYGLWEGYGHHDWDGIPVFRTPERDEILLAGPLDQADSPARNNDEVSAEIPDLWWPQDRAWCVGGDVDLVSTYVGGSAACVADLLATPSLEACSVTETTTVN
ncbi:hypothetical protein [Streptomyces sp. NBC_01314]|uniref:hypothetical protein n=1 Tax=Streptomyces sp. NBC_01314 TaxID=2903821 RepID=UPI0030918A45|nr:hypothetical protein OG622_04180 [Streptomyces sp. NBC_01314]